MTINSPLFGAPCKILSHGVSIILTKLVDQPKTLCEELVNGLKTVGTRVTKNNIGKL